MTNNIKWYDSRWLGIYLAAKEIIHQVAPEKSAEFERRLAILRTESDFDCIALKGFLEADCLHKISETIKSIPKEKFELHELRRFGRFVVHDFPPFTELQKSLIQRVSHLVGEPVEASYNFLSMYTKLGICEPHLDAPSAKWTLDICIDQSEPWPIYFSQIITWPEERHKLGENWQAEIKSNPELTFSPKILAPGDAILFSGSSQWHYRDALANQGAKNFCDLLFFHFIPEGSSDLIQPRNWEKIFGIPELGRISQINERM